MKFKQLIQEVSEKDKYFGKGFATLNHYLKFLLANGYTPIQKSIDIHKLASDTIGFEKHAYAILSGEVTEKGITRPYVVCAVFFSGKKIYLAKL